MKSCGDELSPITEAIDEADLLSACSNYRDEQERC